MGEELSASGVTTAEPGDATESPAVNLDFESEKLCKAIETSSKSLAKALIISRQDSAEKSRAMLDLLKEDSDEEK